MQSLETKIKNMRYNLKVYDKPELINAFDLPEEKFMIDEDREHIVRDVINYFKQDPKVWSLPAKNIFVRICLAYYLDKHNFVHLLNTDSILPYEDNFSLCYSQDQEIYDKIITQIDIDRMEELPGYKKTIEVFGYLYNTPLHNSKLTVGYNCTGQEFFDTIRFKKKVIEEFFFSFCHTMPREPLNPDEIFDQLVHSEQYNIPANLLLNSNEECADWEHLVNRAFQCCQNLQAVTIMDIGTARAIKKRYPELKLHVSTAAAQDFKTEDIDPDIIYCVNLNEPDFYTEHQQNHIKACRELGVKLKYIVNRGCVFDKHDLMSTIADRPIQCCNHYQCKQLLIDHPWLDLIRTNLYKEQIRYLDVDYLKLSTRERPNKVIHRLLEYWTSPEMFTTHIGRIPLNNNTYKIFLEWIKTRDKCDGKCATCPTCKEYYKKFTE